MTGVRPNWVFQVAEIADDVDVGAKFPRLAALGWLSCTYQAGEKPRYVAFWHNPDLQRPLELGSIMAALPTFGAECLVIAAFQTWRRGVAKVGT